MQNPEFDFLRLSLDAAKHVSCSCTTPSDYSIIEAVHGFAPAVASSLKSVWEQQLASFLPMQNVMLHVDTADDIAQVKSYPSSSPSHKTSVIKTFRRVPAYTNVEN